MTSKKRKPEEKLDQMVKKSNFVNFGDFAKMTCDSSAPLLAAAAWTGVNGEADISYVDIEGYPKTYQGLVGLEAALQELCVLEFVLEAQARRPPLPGGRRGLEGEGWGPQRGQTCQE